MKNKGFSLIELLVVISIIGVLASIVISSLGESQARARDARRQSDMRTLWLALFTYDLDHGGFPTSAAYSQNESGGWDLSDDGDFMQFLIDDGYLGGQILDPINSRTPGSVSYLNDTDYFYRVRCLNTTSPPGLRLSYRSEKTGNAVEYAGDQGDSGIINDDFNCLTSLP